MTTPCELLFYDAPKSKCDACAADILKEAKRLESKYNYFDSGSLLHQINSRQHPTIDEETSTLLQNAKEYHQATQGIFDITTATIKDSYNLTKLSHLQKDINKLQAHIGVENFEVKNNQIYFSNPFTKIDLGGMVKEYAVDRAVVVAKQHQMFSALINFGGDIRALGIKPDGRAFQIGIKNPKNPNEELFNVPIADMALTTSASYERKKTIEGTDFSHIIATKKHANSPLSATVIAPTTLESGVYSTALMVDKNLATPHKKYLVLDDLSIHN